MPCGKANALHYPHLWRFLMFGNNKKKIAALEDRLAQLDHERENLQQQLEQARAALTDDAARQALTSMENASAEVTRLLDNLAPLNQ